MPVEAVEPKHRTLEQISGYIEEAIDRAEANKSADGYFPADMHHLALLVIANWKFIKHGLEKSR